MIKETLTFQPKINNHIPVSSTFEERNNRLILLRHHYQFKSVNSKKLSLEEKQEKEQIIQSAIKRLYLPKRINESKNFNDINNSHLQTNSHNREIVNNSSFQKNSVIRNENRNSSIIM